MTLRFRNTFASIPHMRFRQTQVTSAIPGVELVRSDPARVYLGVQVLGAGSNALIRIGTPPVGQGFELVPGALPIEFFWDTHGVICGQQWFVEAVSLSTEVQVIELIWRARTDLP